jgi:hypothetical protein
VDTNWQGIRGNMAISERPALAPWQPKTTPDLTLSGPTVAELRVRVDVLNKVLSELVGRTAPADSDLAGLLRVALDHARAIAEVIEG